ncbi:MAG: 1-deoxy-D-xylulose-5-phosphate reductoisomerase [Flavobacteriaceae bacterium]|nr:1-deoxy-D-xylulose-5-phosphate reductoisomerase [Flavobacteriaceae bacterium]
MNTETKKRIAILGSTGSIGTQAIDVIKANPDLFVIEVLTAGYNADLLITQALELKPNAVVIADESKYQFVKETLQPHDIKVFAGHEAICQVVQMETIDLVLAALVGFSGLKPVIEAIKSHKTIALANKETLVVAGQLITELAEQYRVSILPVDSEHSAIFQCLVGENPDSIEKLILTASGGPFRGMSRQQLETVTPIHALKHPNWTMGAKVTIDSASLMNKGLEMIEAKWLFGIDVRNIEVVVHPQSIIHSLVQFNDGSMKAQLGLPDMKLPIQYAMAFPHRIHSNFPRFEFTKYPSLTFEKPDLTSFRNLGLAVESISQGGNMPCALNAANEVAVQAFLEGKVTFLGMSDLIEDCLTRTAHIKLPSIDDLIHTDETARRATKLNLQ